MRRTSSACTIALLVASGIAAGALAPDAGAGTQRSAATPTRIAVKASEFKFALSKLSVPIGTTVIFTVVNKGKISHDFKIAGKKTPTLAPGKSATVTITFKVKGRFAYVCTLPGHSAAGMKGTFAIGVAPVTTTPVPTTTAPASTTTPTPVSTAPETLKGDPIAGKAVFLANGCAACHTLAAANATGTVGPSLDARKPTQGTVSATIQSGAIAGGATMPSFNLSAIDLANIAAFVYQATHP